jgi:hypothetical protein
MQRQLTRRISELLMDMDGAPQAASSVAVNGRNVPMSYGQGDHHVQLSYVTPAEQMLLADVDMYNSDPPHRGPAGIPNFNAGGGMGGGEGEGEGDADGGDAGAFGGMEGEFGGIGDQGAGVGVGAGTGTGVGTEGGSLAESESEAAATAALGIVSGTEGTGTLAGGTGKKGDPLSEDIDPLTGYVSPTTAEAVAAADALSVDPISGRVSPTTAEAVAAVEATNNAISAHMARTRSDVKRGLPNSQVQANSQNSLQNMETFGFINTQDALSIAGRGIPAGGLGAFSPGGYAANNSTTEGLTMADIVDINAVDPATGQYAVNIPAPKMGTPAFDLAISSSRAYANAFPDIADAMFAIGSFLPGVGPVASLAGILEGRGIGSLISRGLPTGFTAPVSDFFENITAPVSNFFENITAPVSNFFEDIPDPPFSDVGDIGGVEDIGGPGEPDITVVPATPTVPETPAVPETLDELTLRPALTQNLPPERITSLAPVAQQPFNLPPVFTEEDARALLQQTGQLPFAGIV